MSAPTQASPFWAWTAAIRARRSVTFPVVPGNWNMAPNTSSLTAWAAGPTLTSKPKCTARSLTTSITWGCTSSATKKRLDLDLAMRLASAMASAAAVASSSREALARSMPVRSRVSCWKLSSASRRPWASSG
ncbi:hypothetical protein D3C79_925100 [compost metagenome]